MDYLLAILMGIVQGLTEFIPVSSTAHLRILPELLGREDLGAAYTAVIQIGTLFSLLIYFRKEIICLLSGFFTSLKNRDYRNADFLLSIYIILGTLPIVFFGILFKKFIENELRSLTVISERIGEKEKDISSIGMKDAIIIGLAQAVALIPGASRSGVTICMALFLGYKRDVSARFSFLLSIPSVFAAGIYELKDVIKSDFDTGITSVLLATVISFFSGLFAIEFLLRFLVNHRVDLFAYYRIILGIIIVLFFL